MKFVTYLDSKSQPKVALHTGALGSGTLIDTLGGLEWLKAGVAPKDMIAIITDQDRVLPLLRQILAAHKEGKLPANLLIEETKVKLISPIPRPLSMRDGYAFRQHVEAARRNRGLPMIPEFDSFPIFYFT